MTQEHVIGRWNASVIVDADSFTIHKNENEPKRSYASIVYGYGEDPSCEYIAQVHIHHCCAHIRRSKYHRRLREKLFVIRLMIRNLEKMRVR